MQVSAGRHTCVALTAGGEVATWGGNERGELGHGDTLERCTPAFLNRQALQGHQVRSMFPECPFLKAQALQGHQVH
jgi:alpha-tubulin suppressor-like RCC1 family protein